jgi:hypothetical protein
LPPSECIAHWRLGGRGGIGENDVSNNAASVRDDCLVCSGGSLADRGLRTGIQSRKWWSWRGQQFDVCRSRRAGQHFRLRPGCTTIRSEWFGAVRRPAGPNSIQALSERRTQFVASGPPFSPEQLKSVPRYFDGGRRTNSGSLAMFAAMCRASSKTARAALIDDRCGR